MLARIVIITKYAGHCPEHPHWAVPANSDYETVEKQVREHNDAEHQGAETLD